MCKIKYDNENHVWLTEDSKVVHFKLATPAFKLLRTGTYETVITIGGEDYHLMSYSDRAFEIYVFYKGDVGIYELDIPRGHPAYEFFKKEMLRDDKLYYKPLDTPDNWQSY